MALRLSSLTLRVNIFQLPTSPQFVWSVVVRDAHRHRFPLDLGDKADQEPLQIALQIEGSYVRSVNTHDTATDQSKGRDLAILAPTAPKWVYTKLFFRPWEFQLHHHHDHSAEADLPFLRAKSRFARR